MGCLFSFFRTGSFNFRRPTKAKREDEEGGEKRAKVNENEDSETSKENYNPISEELAAAKIQAGFRGYQTRKSLKNSKKGKADSSDPPQPTPSEAVIQPENPPPVAKARGSRRTTTPTETTPLVSAVEKNEESPVLRREPSARRNRAAASKYRSGFVMEDSVSLHDMEAQIENEVLNQAATKIQAGFRGFKTRKSLHGLAGVSTEKEESDGLNEPQTNVSVGDDNVPLEISETHAVVDAALSASPAHEPIADALADNVNVSDASAENANVSANDENKITEHDLPTEIDNGQLASETVESVVTATETTEIATSPPPLIDAKDKSRTPPLVYLRSRSYPGSTEEDLPEEEDETNDDVDMVEIGKSGDIGEGDENDNLSIDLELDEGYINIAATKIQANIRGFLVRNSLRKNGKDRRQNTESEEVESVKDGKESGVEEDLADWSSNIENEVNQENDVDTAKVAATKIQAGFRGFKDRQKIRQKKQAVIRIQATVRGFLTRRRLAKARRKSLQRRRSSAKSISHDHLHALQKANLAATKIQSMYRGYQVRSKLSQNPIQNTGDE